MKNINSILKLIIIMIGLYSTYSCSQQTGHRVNSNTIGVSFIIPEGWVGQETQAGYMLKSNAMAGFILINKNNTSDINTMIYEVQQGFVNNNLNYLQLLGTVENFNNTGIGAEYQGMLEGVSAKAYIVGVLNNMGLGVSIMAATTSEYYSNSYRKLCIDIASSVAKQQSKIAVNQTQQVPQTQQTRTRNKTEELFAGAKLTYIEVGDGYSTKIVIDLCEQGYFYHSSVDSMTANVEGGSAGYGDIDNGAGTWHIVKNENQQDVLQLTFKGGELYNYIITLEDGKTYLGNYRYYREYGAERGARCN